MKKNCITAEEAQILLDLLPLITEDFAKTEEQIKSFKWLCVVPQAGAEYENNRNIWEYQDKGIKRIKEIFDKRKAVIMRLINSLQANPQ